MKRLIINADDYNLTPGCDRAIESAMEAGAVTSTSCLVWSLADMRNLPLLEQMGVHLRLTDGGPLLSPADIPSLVDARGLFPKSRDAVAMRNVGQDEVQLEWRAQIDTFLSVAGSLTHLDTHRHTHGLLNLWGVYADLCIEYGCAGVPLSDEQRDRLRARGVPCADFTEIRWTDGKLGTLMGLLREDFARHETVHLMTHPGVDDQALRARSTMTAVRARELEVLTGMAFRGWLKHEGIRTVGMEELAAAPDPLAKIDILYCAWNRRAFTEASLKTLRDNTDWARVGRLWLYDDGSEDGTLELLRAFAGECRPRDLCQVIETQYRSPVASMNDFLTHRDPLPWFAKIDSDVVLPPNWLQACLSVLDRYPAVDLLGIEAMYATLSMHLGRVAEPCGHIGGIGLMRTAAFRELPVPAGRLGFSDWQIKHDVTKAWLNPALPVILLDRLPFEPWASLSAEYEAKGWQRPWRRYTEADSKLWGWWTGDKH